MSEVQKAPENCQSEPGLHPSPQEGMKVLQTEVLHPATPTDRTVGQKKVSSRNWWSAKPTYIALLFLLLVPTVNFNPIPARKCALCRDPQCAAHRLKICRGDNCTWLDRTLGIKNCSKDNLKPDEPCQLMNGSLVVQSDQPISFEGMKAIPSKNVLCADLDLSPGPKSLLGQSMNTTANTTTPDTGLHRAAIGWSAGGVDIRVVIGVLIVIAVIIGIIVWKCGKRCCQRLGRMGGPQNAAPPDGNIIALGRSSYPEQRTVY
ncbi:uncharacterized protein LOC133140817 isoform X2 [Conger conger]|uniref:uncharacterized protein LOC133140817 isoform X2 n=1 Tax=Conger conger TaxID=82655 RepID=UPI002A5A19C2|nr:uncharacterized protein LOC133140817 isoform X2 [Conger conger]